MKVNVKKLKKATNNNEFKNFEELKNNIKKNIKKFDEIPLGSYNWYKLYDDELLRIDLNDISNLQESCRNEYSASKRLEYYKILFERVKKIAEEHIKENGVNPEWQDNVKKFWDKASKKYYASLEILLDGCVTFLPQPAFYMNMERIYMFHVATNCSVEWEEIENLLRDNMWILDNCAGGNEFKGVKPRGNTDELEANYDENKVIPDHVLWAWYCSKIKLNSLDVISPEWEKVFDEDFCLDFEQAYENFDLFFKN